MMKAWIKKGCAVLLLCLCVCAVFCVQSSAHEPQAQPLSPALQVLAAGREMSVATLCGNDYYNVVTFVISFYNTVSYAENSFSIRHTAAAKFLYY